MFGLTSKQLQEIQKILREELKNQTARVYIFGSRAKGTHRKYSDVDLMIEGLSDASIVQRISDRFEDSLLPYRFDIVTRENCESSYLEDILATRELLTPTD